MSMSEFDYVFDEICSDVFPKIESHIQENSLVNDEGIVDVHEIIHYLTNEVGYDTDMASKIWDCYLYNNKFAPQETDVAS